MKIIFSLIKAILNGFKFKKVLKSFKALLPGLLREYIETKQMLRYLLSRKGNKRRALDQSKDILRMLILFIAFMVPFVGSLLLGLLLKVKSIKPSSFR